MRKDEFVDIYDENKIKKGYTKIRHIDVLEDGEYMIGVQAIILNANNEILISKRSKDKKVLPGLWECNGGAIDANETSIEGLIREIKEELGLNLIEDNIVYYKTFKNIESHVLKDVYIYKADYKISDISFSDGEADDVKNVSINEFEKMFNNNEIVYNVNFDRNDYEECLKLINMNSKEKIKKIDKSVRIATRCYAIQEGKVVTIKYKNKERLNGWYDLPGGKIEIGETSEECAKREFYEETGLTITNLEDCGNLILEYPTRIFDFTIFYIKSYEGIVNPLEKDNDVEIINIEKLLMCDNKLACIKLLEDKYLNKILNHEKLKIRIMIDDKEEIVDIIEY